MHSSDDCRITAGNRDKTQMKSVALLVVRWVSRFLPRLEGREVLICERCHMSGYVKWPCSRCAHIVGTPIQIAGRWTMDF